MIVQESDADLSLRFVDLGISVVLGPHDR
ncbi:unnamed protein product, partial [Rotaria sp. Silwood1]